MPVAVAPRGLKRVCHSCGARYYDFNKRPVVCPGCQTEFNPEIKMRSRKGRNTLVEDDEAPRPAEEAAEAVNENEEMEAGDGETVSLEEVSESEEAGDEDEAEDGDLDIDDDIDDDMDDDDLDDEDEEELDDKEDAKE